MNLKLWWPETTRVKCNRFHLTALGCGSVRAQQGGDGGAVLGHLGAPSGSYRRASLLSPGGDGGATVTGMQSAPSRVLFGCSGWGPTGAGR